MKIYQLKDICVLSFKGNDVPKFLNGLTSNALGTPFNAFVNQHGRIIAVVRQQRISDQEFLMALPMGAVESLLKHLQMYAKIGGIKMEATSQKVYVDLEAGAWIFSEEEKSSTVSEEEFTLYRLAHKLPLQGVDYQADEFVLNVDHGDLVSFTKGCFLGQEPVSKVHNRSKPSKKLVVKFEEECTDEEKVKMTSRIIDLKANKIKGFVFVRNE